MRQGEAITQGRQTEMRRHPTARRDTTTPTVTTMELHQAMNGRGMIIPDRRTNTDPVKSTVRRQGRTEATTTILHPKANRVCTIRA